jgi:hypothetical protein
MIFLLFSAINFPQVLEQLEQITVCDPTVAPAFPYQFSRKDVRMVMNLPDYGSNKFRSNKINYIEQELVTNLSFRNSRLLQVQRIVECRLQQTWNFLSPSEIQNTEIIKFFGEFPLADLIGGSVRCI